VVYAFDPKRREVTRELAPWSGADVVNVPGVSSSGVLVASNNDEILLLDTAAASELYKGPMPIAVPRLLRTGSDGETYCLCDGVFCQWDFEANELVPLAAIQDGRYLTEPSPGTWLFATPVSIFRLRLRQDAGTT
jgi:hypothetical protein